MRTRKIIGLGISLCVALSTFVSMSTFTSYAASQPNLIVEMAGITYKDSTTIKYNYTIKNIGKAKIPSLYGISIQSAFSADTIYNDAEDLLAGTNNLTDKSSLAPGKSYSGTITVNGTVPQGMNCLVFKVDSSNSVIESIETDNDYSLTLPHQATTKMVTLRPEIEKRGIDIRNQGNRLVCVLESMTFLQEYLLTGAYGSKYNHISIDYAVQAGNLKSGVNDDSSNFREFNIGYNTYGAVLDTSWPFDPNYNYDFDNSNAKFDTLTLTGMTLLKDGYRLAGKCIREGDCGPLTDSDIAVIQSYLDRGIPVAQAHNGHSTAIIGYELNPIFYGGGIFIYRESSGSSTGDGGYQTFSYGELEQTGTNVALFAYEIAPKFPKFYTDKNFSGFSVALAPGTYTVKQLKDSGMEEEVISSIVVPAGYKVYIYKASNFNGDCKVLTSSKKDLSTSDFDNSISSIKIEKM